VEKTAKVVKAVEAVLEVGAWQQENSGLADSVARENQIFQQFQSSNATPIIREII